MRNVFWLRNTAHTKARRAEFQPTRHAQFQYIGVSLLTSRHRGSSNTITPRAPEQCPGALPPLPPCCPPPPPAPAPPTAGPVRAAPPLHRWHRLATWGGRREPRAGTRMGAGRQVHTCVCVRIPYNAKQFTKYLKSGLPSALKCTTSSCVASRGRSSSQTSSSQVWLGQRQDRALAPNAPPPLPNTGVTRC